MAEWRSVFDRYLSDVNYRPGRTELIDLSRVTQADAGFRSIWSALNTVNGQLPGATIGTRTVFIAPGDVVFGLARIYQTLAENAGGIRVEIFRGEAEALAALGLPFDTVADLLAQGAFLPHAPRGGAADGP